MDLIELSHHIRDDLLPKRKNNTEVLIVETSEPVYTKFEKRAPRSRHTFKLVFQRGNRIYVNGRGLKNGWDIIDVFGNNVRITDAYWKDSNAKGKLTYQDVLNRRYDEFTWKNLTPEILKSPMGHTNPKTRYISTVFSSSIIKEIKQAFEFKEDMILRIDGNRRDLSVKTRWDAENKNYMAWFSSEISGTLNGDYYLLMNPTFAVFYEND